MSSILDPTGKRLIEVMGRNYLTLLGRNPPVWEIQDEPLFFSLIRWIKRDPFRQISYDERCALLLKELIHAADHVILGYSEDPIDESLSLIGAGSDTWEVPQATDANRFYKFLYLGNWTLMGFNYVPNCPSSIHIDLFCTKPEKYTLKMQQENIVYVLDAFHDNEPWRLAINPGVVDFVR